MRQQTVTITTDISDMPSAASINCLCDLGGYANYIERGNRWQYVFVNGVFYTGRAGSSIGQQCSPSEKLDPVFIQS